MTLASFHCIMMYSHTSQIHIPLYFISPFKTHLLKQRLANICFRDGHSPSLAREQLGKTSTTTSVQARNGAPREESFPNAGSSRHQGRTGAFSDTPARDGRDPTRLSVPFRWRCSGVHPTPCPQLCPHRPLRFATGSPLPFPAGLGAGGT